MKIVLISGLSGSGKSVALKLLEDLGYYCVDNLPMSLLPSLVMHHIGQDEIEQLGISVDIRSRIDIHEAEKQIAALRAEGHEIDVLFLEAEEGVLVRRFSETRRGHPLSGQSLTLLESLQQERAWLSPLREIAYCIDTSKMNAQQLRYSVQQWLKLENKGLLVILESFGFKYGVPREADLVFDLRFLANPYFVEALRPLSGKDKAVADYVFTSPHAREFRDKLVDLLFFMLPLMETEGRYRITVALGCTGGRHRSVAMAEEILQALRQADYPAFLEHRHLELG